MLVIIVLHILPKVRGVSVLIQKVVVEPVILEVIFSVR